MISAFLLGTTLSLLSMAPMPRDTIPEPQTVATDEISVPVTQPSNASDTSSALYYLIFDGRSERFDENDPPERILRTLQEQDLAVEAAWFPILSSIKVPCMAPNVYPALVVKLTAPNESITELDFTADPGRAHPNCGVEAFHYYAFD